MFTPSVKLLPPPGSSVRDIHPSLPFDPSAHPSISPIFFDALAVRFPVFVEEQHCSAVEEIDQDDTTSWHWVAYIERIGHAQKVAAASIRLVPVSPIRGHGTGDLQARESIRTEKETWDGQFYDALNGGSEEMVDRFCKVNDEHENDAKKAIGPRHEKTEMWDGNEPFVKLGRLAALMEYRKLGLGRLLVDAALDWLEQNPEKAVGEVEISVVDKALVGKWKGLVLVHAQKAVERFWGSCGFVKDGEMGEWWEEGIEHAAMWKRIKAN